LEQGKGYSEEFAKRHIATHKIDYDSYDADMRVVNRSEDFRELRKASQIITTFDSSLVKEGKTGIWVGGGNAVSSPDCSNNSDCMGYNSHNYCTGV
jgi:hypothetical protein